MSDAADDALAARAVELLGEVALGLVAIRRASPLPAHLARRENDAEHTCSLAVVACALIDLLEPGLDAGLVAQLALAHDLVEVYAGDSPVGDATLAATQAAREEAALERFRDAWRDLPWLARTIEAFERQDTPEAVYVRALDKAIPLLLRLVPGGVGWREEEGLDRVAVAARIARMRGPIDAHPGVRRLYDALLVRAFADDANFA